MKHLSTFLAPLLFAAYLSTSHAEPENLLDNGDFSKGRAGWETDGKVVELTPDGKAGAEPDPFAVNAPVAAAANKVLVVKLEKSKSREIAHEFKVPHDAQGVKLKFRVMPDEEFDSKANAVGALTIKFMRTDGSSIFYSIPVQAKPNEWKEFAIKCGELGKATDLTLRIEIKPGKGTLTFDDFVLEAI